MMESRVRDAAADREEAPDADRRVRVAVVGAGGAAQVVHLPILRRLPSVEIVGIADPHQEKARTIADRFQVSDVAPEMESLPGFADRVDALVICTPNDTHAELAITALEAGKHVMVERPIAPDPADAARMIQAAREAGRQLMVAMNQRFRMDIRSLREFVASGELGEIVFVRSSWLNREGRHPGRGWRTDPDRSGGGVLMDLGVQAVDVVLWLLGYPEVDRISARLHRSGRVEDSAVVLMGVPDGPTISVEVTWELKEEKDRHGIYVLGSRGSGSTGPFRVLKELETGLTEVTPPLDTDRGGLYTGAYRQEWAEFLRRVRGEVPLVFEDEQVRLMEIVRACYRSAREGREVSPDGDPAR